MITCDMITYDNRTTKKNSFYSTIFKPCHLTVSPPVSNQNKNVLARRQKIYC